MHPRLLVIADDLTGALDTGVLFSRAGVRTTVVPGEDNVTGPAGPDPAVVVVDTESRHLPPDRAGSRVASCVRAALARGIERFYKKTDSTLRGNVGAELCALVSASGGRELFFVPALPKAGRVTRSGVQFVDGVPLHESAFARDPREPALGSSVEAIIGRQCGIPVVTVGRGADPEPLMARAGRPLIVAFDAETDEDIEAIADRLVKLGVPRLTAGCSGFAAVLPRLHDLPAARPAPPTPGSPLLVVSGSLHERSVAQLRAAEVRGAPTLAVDPAVIGQPGWRSTAGRTIVGQLREHGVMVVHSCAGRAASPSLAAALLREMGTLVKEVVDASGVPTIALFGGDTAFAVVEALGIDALEPLGEICQGVVASSAHRADGTSEGARYLVTKAGGFGPVDVIDRIRGALAGER